MRLSITNVLRYLEDNRLINLDPNSQPKVKRLPGKNFVACIESPRSKSLIVKQSPLIQHVMSSGDLSREATLYSYLSITSSVAFNKYTTPSLIKYDSAHDILVLEYVENSEDIESYHQRSQSFSPDMARGIATLLVDIHVASAMKPRNYLALQDSAGKSYSTVFNYHITPHEYAMSSPGTQRLLSIVQSDRQLTDALDDLRREWRQVCLVHGDFRFSNILYIFSDHDAVKLNYKIIDWEYWSWGDPAWDVGTVLGEYIRSWAFSIKVADNISIESWFKGSGITFPAIRNAIKCFWETYFSRVHNDEVSYQIQERAIRFAGAYLLGRCASALDVDSHISALVLCVLRVSKALLTNPDNARALLHLRDMRSRFS